MMARHQDEPELSINEIMRKYQNQNLGASDATKVPASADGGVRGMVNMNEVQVTGQPDQDKTTPVHDHAFDGLEPLTAEKFV
jgi:hypothetical protein